MMVLRGYHRPRRLARCCTWPRRPATPVAAVVAATPIAEEARPLLHVAAVVAATPIAAEEVRTAHSRSRAPMRYGRGGPQRP